MSSNKSVVLRLLPPVRAEVAKADWIVGPCGQTRDSDLPEQANFTYVVELMDELDPNGTDHEVLSWNHWNVGWIEEMACRPESECRALQASLYARLDEEEVLSTDLLSEMEYEASVASETDTAVEIEIGGEA